MSLCENSEQEPYDYLGAFEQAKLRELQRRHVDALARSNSAWDEHCRWADEARRMMAMIERIEHRERLQ